MLMALGFCMHFDVRLIRLRAYLLITDNGYLGFELLTVSQQEVHQAAGAFFT